MQPQQEQRENFFEHENDDNRNEVQIDKIIFTNLFDLLSVLSGKQCRAHINELYLFDKKKDFCGGHKIKKRFYKSYKYDNNSQSFRHEGFDYPQRDKESNLQIGGSDACQVLMIGIKNFLKMILFRATRVVQW